ncbi:MAG TPA: AAC(3) family N-acetyltransferase [Candidatus Ratteibacteria bacterium]|nr:AAC(3) family N-acetyltransferase [Candidatus Ratteibacteria bacterium]
MKKFYDEFKNQFDVSRWKNFALKIYNIESKFCYRDFEKSARICLQELKDAGAKDVELIELNADGETVYGDFIMPEAWDYEYGHLSIVEPVQFNGKILADTRQHPFHIANRCGDIEGTVLNVVDIRNMNQYKNLSRCLVFCGNIHPKECRQKIEESGAAGIISCYSGAPEKRNGIFWINGWVKNSGWYHTKQDKKMVCFSITPADGDFLQNLLNTGDVKVYTSVKSKRYNGKIYSITGLIPGKTKKEVAFLAHLYEPMITDNASGVAGLIEMCRVFNRLIREKKFVLDTGIRFLFSMERYGMAQFFEKNRNIVYAFNVDGITPDIVKSGRMRITLYGSQFTRPFFGDWIFEKILEGVFPQDLPWKKERPMFEDDTFVSDLSINVPTIYFISHPGRFHHNSVDPEIVNWNIGKHILCSLATYAWVLCSNSLRHRYINIPDAFIKQEFYAYISRLSLMIDENPEKFDVCTIKERIFYIATYLKNKYSSMAGFHIKPDEKILEDIDLIARKTTADIEKRLDSTHAEKKLLSREEKKAENIVITWRKPVFVFSLSEIPHKERIHPPEEFYSAINRVDGKKDLYRIFQEISWEREFYGIPELDEQEKRQITKYIQYLSKYGYVKIRYKVITTKQDIKRELGKLGIKKGDYIIVHSSLSSLGYVEGGPEAVCEALMELIGKDGLLMMPCFNHGEIFKNNPQAYFSPVETPTINGTIPETFRKMKNVYRSLNPTHSFAVWGKNAKDFVKDHHKYLTMGKGSPLYLLEKAGGKIVLIDAISANTFHHVVEETNNVPCLGKRTEQYPVKLPSGEIVKIRTWSWREKSCEITDKTVYLDYMRKNKLLKEGKIGNADVLVIDMNVCRQVIEKFLNGKIKGFSGCKKCPIRPWVVPQTVESDWDNEKEQVKKDTDAFVGDYNPTSSV